MGSLQPEETIALGSDPVRRRWFILLQALQHSPLDDAMVLAQRVERFLTDGGYGAPLQPSGPKLPDTGETATSQEPAEASGIEPTSIAPIKDQVISRLAGGASDSEIVVEFGLTKRQVQGFRLGMGPSVAAEVAAPDDIVRFLRQQGDVVVNGDGGYLVNARFNLTLVELVDRANRMRARQKKALFRVVNAKTPPTDAGVELLRNR